MYPAATKLPWNPRLILRRAQEAQAFVRAAGVARFTWNWALAQWKAWHKAGKKPTAMKLKKHFNAIKGELFPWVYDSLRDANAQPFANLGQAFRNFFAGQAKYPRFKKKGKCRDAFYVANDKFHVEGDMITLPRIGKVKMREALRFDGKVICATVSRTANRWFVSISVEVDLPVLASENQTRRAGVDLGVKNLATVASLGDEIIIEGPKPLRAALKRLKRLNRSLSRKAKGSKNREKVRLRLARCHTRIAGVRTDALHKLTTWLVRTYGCVVIEDLGVKGMVRNRKLARVISDMGFGEFRRQLEYKSELSEGEIVVADRWFPSSKRCRQCDMVNESLTLKDRIFTCSGCGHVEDRDVHAARNLERYPRLIGESDARGHLSAGSAARPLSGTRVVEAGIPSVSLKPF